jgi:hypothetical protein
MALWPSCSWTIFGWTPAWKRKCRHGVAEVVEPDGRYVGALAGADEHRVDALRVVPLAELVDEHVAGLDPRRSGGETLEALALAVLGQHGDSCICRWLLPFGLIVTIS